MPRDKVLEDGNFVLVMREHVGFSDDQVVTITSKMKSGWKKGSAPDLVLSEDEWKDVQRAAVRDDPKNWSS